MRIKKIGNLFGATGGSFAGNIYDPEGLAPTLNTAEGGYREPMILEIYEDGIRNQSVTGQEGRDSESKLV